METKHASLERTASRTSGKPVSRRSSTLRIKPQKHASSDSLNPIRTPSLSDDQSLTSFPSLSPSEENSPQGGTSHGSTTRTARPQLLNHQQSQPSVAAAPPLDRLFSRNARADGHSDLFGDSSQDTNDLPGTVHLQSDQQIERLVSKIGVVPLVKQMARDLAERDAQITRIQRRAEDRERSLWKLLQECEISSLQIETRLRELEGSEADSDWSSTASSRRLFENGSQGHFRSPVSPGNIIQTRMLEALGNSTDEVATLSQPSLEDNERTPRKPSSIKGSAAQQKLVRSLNSSQNIKDNSATGKNWKDYFRPAPTVDPQRTLKPPMNRSASSKAVLGANVPASTSQPNNASSDSSKTTAAGPSWAMRLFGGASTQETPPSKQASRNRASTTQNTSRANSSTRVQGLQQATARQSPRGSISSVSGRGGTTKKSTPQNVRSSASNRLSANSPPESIGSGSANFGPVEMDAILPEESRPPTLLTNGNQSDNSEYLTDRFGFIYDQRRRKRQKDAAAAAASLPRNKRGSQVEPIGNLRKSILSSEADNEDAVSDDAQSTMLGSSPRAPTPTSMAESIQTRPEQPKRWHEYLKLSTVPAVELLSHTPSAAPITSITVAKADPMRYQQPASTTQSTTSETLKIASVSNPAAISEATTTSEIVEAVRPSSNSVNNEAHDPVKSLLDQLTEVHDILQRDRTAKWNEFLRKVRAERRRDGEATIAAQHGQERSQSAAAAMPEVMLADGEVVGVATLGNKGKVGRAKWIEFRNLVLGGIPVAYRAKIWAECSGASTLRSPGYYDELVADTFASDDADPAIEQQIQMDITRTLTDNVFFRNGQGITKLREVLLAYARRNPAIGYCQGMNLITANLLLIMPTAEDAFWLLTTMIENILPDRYYDSSLLASRADQVVLRSYVSTLLPSLSSHLDNLGVELEALTFQWFLSVFTDCLSAEALFRVWDVVLCINEHHRTGVFLFQVALALLKLNERELLACESPAEVYAYINQRMTDHAISIDGLIKASEGLKGMIKKEDIEVKRKEAIEAEEEKQRERDAIRRERTHSRNKNSVATDILAPLPVANEANEASDPTAPEPDTQGAQAGIDNENGS